MNDRVNVTRTFLPPYDEYERYLKEIWASDQLTNQGPLLHNFEQQVSEYLGVDTENFRFVTNGTLALQVALKALGITDGEVITTPFSYVATVSSILWERCEPVFVDIETDTFCIDPAKIEAAITPNTKAIMPVHVFGNPCDVDAIEAIAKKHGLKVIYDGAHAFGVKYKGKSLLSYGDISICSFHATKPFHTIEGGALVIKDREVSDKARLIKAFGHDGDTHYMLGINAKASEFQAAMGLSNLPHLGEITEGRKRVVEQYARLLGETVQKVKMDNQDVQYNYAYYPVLFADENKLLSTIDGLQTENIFPRRYFYPSLNTLPYLQNSQSCPVSEDVAKRILCLPLYPGLQEEVITKICEAVNR